MDRSDARLNQEANAKAPRVSERNRASVIITAEVGETVPLVGTAAPSAKSSKSLLPCIPKGFACWLLAFALVVFVILVLLYTATLPADVGVLVVDDVTSFLPKDEEEPTVTKFRVAFYVLIVAYGVILLVWLLTECVLHRRKLAQMKLNRKYEDASAATARGGGCCGYGNGYGSYQEIV